MALDFCEGFEKYGPVGSFEDLQDSALNLYSIMAGEWALISTSGSIIPKIVAPLSAKGAALQMDWSSQGNGIKRSFAASGRVIGGCWFNWHSSSGSIPGIVYQKGGTTCFSIVLGANITIRQQDITGTIIQTAAATITSDSTHTLKWDVTIGASSSYSVWLDDVLILSGTGNTGNGQTTVDTIVLGSPGVAIGFSNRVIFDNVWQFNTSGSVSNSAPAVTPVVDTEFATSDNTVAWAATQGQIGAPYSETITTYNPGANQLVLRKFTPAFNCTLQSVNILPQQTSATANFKAVLYSDSAGSPNTLLATGTQVTTCATDVLLTMPFGSGQALTGGTPVWIGFINDTGIQFPGSDATTVTWRKSNAYASGPPTPAGAATTTTDQSMLMFGAVTGITGNNWSIVTNNPPPQPMGQDVCFNSSSTVGQEDLLNFAALQQTPNNIYGMQLKVIFRNSDGGARTVDIRTKSGATDDPGSAPGQTPLVTYSWLASTWTVDPNTSAAWTSTNLNNALGGYKVAS